MDFTRRVHAAAHASAIAVAAVLVCAAVAAQSPQPQVFRSTADLVPVDVRVLDRQGKPVTDLTQDDFTILENGVPQPIRHFSVQRLMPETPATRTSVTSGALAAGRTARDSGEAGLEPQNRRVFLIVLGRGRLQPPAKGVDGMLHFVRERLLPQDVVSVLAWNRATAFTTDRAAVLEVLERFKRAHEGIETRLLLAQSGLAAIYGSPNIPASLQGDIDAVFGGPNARGVRSMPPGLSPGAARTARDNRETTDLLLNAPESDEALGIGMALDDFVSTNAQTQQDLGNLYRGIEYLRHAGGEKHLIFVSAAGLMLPRAEDDLDLASAAAHARVVIDYIHTSGVPMQAMDAFSAENGRGAGARGGRGLVPAGRAGGAAGMWLFATARTVAQQTGGRFWSGQLPSAADDMDAIDRTSRFGYLLGYSPINTRLDGKFRRIAVRVNRPGLTVLYRHGYFAEDAPGPLDVQRALTYSRVAGAASYQEPVPDLGFRATAAVEPIDGARRVVRATIDLEPSRFEFDREAGRNTDTLEIALFCADPRDALVGQVWKTVHLSYTDDRLAALTREGLRLLLSVDTTTPPRNLKVVVYDHGSDRVGSVIVKLP